jgi:U3 small nucleolar RNA-associated protein 13
MLYKRVHTLPLYESIEAIQLLPNFYHYIKNKKLVENLTKNDLVVATAGAKGLVRMWKTTRTQRQSDEVPRISGLVSIAEQEVESSFGQKRGGYTGLLLTSHKHQLYENQSNNEEHAGTQTFAEELIAIDAEHNMSFLNLIDDKNRSSDPSLLGLNRTIIGHNDEILDLKIIPNQKNENETDLLTLRNKRVAIATNSAQVRLFDLASYSCNVLDGHTDTVLTLDVSPCGGFLVTSGKDKTTRIWDLESLKCVAVATGHTEAIGATALSRKTGRYDVVGKAAGNGAGSFIVTASKDKTLKRWNLPGSSALGEIAKKNLESLSLSVFCSVRAHEKVRLLLLNLRLLS